MSSVGARRYVVIAMPCVFRCLTRHKTKAIVTKQVPICINDDEGKMS